MTKIAIQGVHGCFHEQAARLFYGNEIGVCECLSFEDLFVALDQGKASGAIMAIENTVAGGLLPNYSLLHKHSRKVKGEVFLRIQQNLMALPGTDKDGSVRLLLNWLQNYSVWRFFRLV